MDTKQTVEKLMQEAKEKSLASIGFTSVLEAGKMVAYKSVLDLLK